MGTHPVIGRERLALDDPDRRELARPPGVERFGRFLLHQLVDLFVEGEAVGVDGAEGHSGR
jgi:hypothetical protein